MKNKKTIFLILLVVLLTAFAFRPVPAESQVTCEDVDGDGVITLVADGSGECATIQDAVDISSDGGVIRLGDGTYQENITIEEKYVTITGNTDDPSAVIVDANYTGRAFYLVNVDTGVVEISGMTIINGYADTGGGLYSYNSAFHLDNCIFHNNDGTNSGGGVAVYSLTSDSTISRCKFYLNHSASSGGAIYTSYLGDICGLTIENSVFYDNDASRDGGAVYAGIDSYPAFYNNTFAYNEADEDGGALYIYGDNSGLQIKNNIFHDNEADADSQNSEQGGGIYLNSYLIYGSIDYNDFYSNDPNHAYIKTTDKSPSMIGEGNLAYDPLFTDTTADDYTLQEASMIINTGSDLSELGVVLDYDGKTRPIGEGYDMGAYEYGEEVEVVEEEEEEEEATGNTTYNVSIEDYVFNDNDVIIDLGDSVIWTNNGAVDHLVSSDDFEDSEILAPGDTYTVTFTEAGTYNYICAIHFTMTGYIIVRDADGNIIEEEEEVPTEEDEEDAEEPVEEETIIACGDFLDVDSVNFTEEQCEAIEWVQEQGIFTGGDVTGELAPSDYINRAETTKVLLEAFGFATSDEVSTYSDVADGEWYTPYIMGATREGIVQGYSDGTFAPANTVNMVEMLKIVLETADVDLSSVDIDQELFSDIPVNQYTEWYRAYAYYAYENGLVDVEAGEEFGAGNDILREDVILVLYRLNEAGLW